MIIQIALGIVLAVIILAYLPQILGYGFVLAIIGLGIGFVILVASSQGMQIWIAFMLMLGVIVIAKEKTSKYWKPPLDKLESRMRLHLSALIQATALILGGIAALIASPYYYSDYIASTVILVIAGLSGLGFGYWTLKSSREKFTIPAM